MPGDATHGADHEGCLLPIWIARRLRSVRCCTDGTEKEGEGPLPRAFPSADQGATCTQSTSSLPPRHALQQVVPSARGRELGSPTSRPPSRPAHALLLPRVSDRVWWGGIQPATLPWVHALPRYRVAASRRCRIAAPAPYGGGALRFKEPHDASSDPVERVLPKGSEIPLDATDVDAAQLVEKRNRTARQASLSGAEARIHGRVLARPSADLCGERDNDEGWIAQRAGRTSHHDHRSLAFLFMSLRSMERKSHEKHVARGNRSLTDHAPHLL